MEQIQPLLELLRQCTVRLVFPGISLGTGFFVAPGWVLTCAHVVRAAQQSNSPLEAYWKDKFIGPAPIHEFLLEEIIVKDPVSNENIRYLYPDLALLEVKLTDHPCVCLDSNVSHGQDLLYSYGYTKRYPSGDGSRFTYEDESWIDNQKPLLKFKGGEALSGLSGAPLLDLSIGNVCGIVQSSRGDDKGGRAIPTRIIFEKQELGELVSQHNQFHENDRRWKNCLTAKKHFISNYLEHFDVILSHWYTDAEWVENLAKGLEGTQGFRICQNKWIKETSDPPWQQSKICNLTQSNCWAICIGEQTPVDWVQEEIQRAIDQQYKNPYFRIIPILLPNIKTLNIDKFPDLRSWADFRQSSDRNYALHVLVTGIRGRPPGRWPLVEDIGAKPRYQRKNLNLDLLIDEE